MPEYIIEIEEDQSDESEVFIGWIRRHSKQLIRCKDCKHWYGKYHFCEIIDDSRDWDAYDYCSIAERKEE